MPYVTIIVVLLIVETPKPAKIICASSRKPDGRNFYA